MAGQQPVFEIVRDEEPVKESPTAAAGTRMLLLGLGALSQRALAAVADLFTLATVGSAFWLWMSIHEPNPNQLIALAMYALFVLAANWIVRRR